MCVCLKDNEPDILGQFVAKVSPDYIFHLAASCSQSYLSPVYTWKTNVMGTFNLLESLKTLKSKCVCIIITTDKVYKNCEQISGYDESDMLGGYDPIVLARQHAVLVNSWVSSFCSIYIYIATAEQVMS